MNESDDARSIEASGKVARAVEIHQAESMRPILVETQEIGRLLDTLTDKKGT